jgi:hypothetical protein
MISSVASLIVIEPPHHRQPPQRIASFEWPGKSESLTHLLRERLKEAQPDREEVEPAQSLQLIGSAERLT